MVKHALAESEACRLLLENTAGAGNTLGRSFEELRELIDLAGGEKRLGVCLDSCHMFASGFDITTADKVTEVVDDFKKTVGIRRLRCLHVNDSLAPLGSNRDRHAVPGEGEIGAARLRGLPLGAALREAAGALRGPGRERPRAREGRRGQDEEAAREGAARAQAAREVLGAAFMARGAPVVGIRRLRCLHVNDSMTPLGSNRDRHTVPGEGEIGPRGCAAFLSEPAFEKLPALFEGPGANGHAPEEVDVDTMKKLRKKGLRARR